MVNFKINNSVDNSLFNKLSTKFLIDLHNKFNNRLENLLKERIILQKNLDDGYMPNFLEETKHIRDNDEWKVGEIPIPLRKRTVEITGPVDRKMIINALNSGANCFMADFEDSSSPTWENMINGQINLRDAITREIEFYDSRKNKHYKLNDEISTLLVRPRGFHLIEKNITIDGKHIRASLFDFGLYFITNYKQLLRNGAGPYFYLPKLENHKESQLWNDIFLYSENYVNLNIGSIKATILIEHILAAFQMEEILYSLKDYIVGLNCGRWDYIFSFIKKFRYNPKFILPNRSQITMNVHFMKSYVKLLTYTCHKRGAYAMGGMAAEVPSRDIDLHKKNLKKVYEDKLLEAESGMDGTWIAHPGLLQVALDAFNHCKDYKNDDKCNINDKDLLQIPKGTITHDGVRENVLTCLKYLDSWISGIGCVAMNNKMEDAATAEISRMQLWQWIYHKISVNGKLIDKDYINRIILSDTTKYKHDTEIKSLLNKMIFSKEPIEFMTIPSYDLIS